MATFVRPLLAASRSVSRRGSSLFSSLLSYSSLALDSPSRAAIGFSLEPDLNQKNPSQGEKRQLHCSGEAKEKQEEEKEDEEEEEEDKREKERKKEKGPVSHGKSTKRKGK